MEATSNNSEVNRTPPTPAPKDNVTYSSKPYQVVREGLAEILKHEAQDKHGGKKSQSQAVFYNPIQQFNRDLSVLAIRVFGEDLLAVRNTKRERRLASGKDVHRGKKRKREIQDERNKVKATCDENGTILDEVRARPTDADSNPSVHSTGKEKQDGSHINAPSTDDAPNDKSEEIQVPSSNDVLPSNEGDSTAHGHFPFRILDALSATGLRALRYAKEIPITTSVTANDLSPQATASTKLNITHNQVSEKVRAITGDARSHMHSVASPTQQRDSALYEVIDLDPYGTATPFLDAAVKAVIDGGLLCVTCTDAGVFASVGYLEKTFSQYGGLPLKGPHAHEGGLRLILHAIAMSAARYSISIEPLLSLSIDFYARVFVRVRRSPAEVKYLASKTMTVYSCDQGCGAWSTQFHAVAHAKPSARAGADPVVKFTLAQAPTATPYCAHCGFKTHLAGPMWGGPLHNPIFIQRILELLPSLDGSTYATLPRIEGMLTLALSEPLFDTPPFPTLPPPSSPSRPIPPLDPALRCTHPFFLNPSTLAKILHCVAPSDAALRGALLRLGYRVSRSHTKAGSIATDAPWSVVWEVMREWVRQKAPIKDGAIAKGTPGWGVMRRDRTRSAVRAIGEEVTSAWAEVDDVQSAKMCLEKALKRICAVEEEKKEGVMMKNGDLMDEGEGEGEGEGTGGEKALEPSSPPSPSSPQSKAPHRLDIVFDENLGREHIGKKIVRYQMNPRPDWGPLNRAKGG